MLRGRAAASLGFRPRGCPEVPPPATVTTWTKYWGDKRIKSWPKLRIPHNSVFPWKKNGRQPWSLFSQASDFPRAASRGGRSTVVPGDVSQAVLAKPALKLTPNSTGSSRRGGWPSEQVARTSPGSGHFWDRPPPGPASKTLQTSSDGGDSSCHCEVTMVTGDSRQPAPQPPSPPSLQPPGSSGTAGLDHRLPRGPPFSHTFLSGSLNSKAGVLS